MSGRKRLVLLTGALTTAFALAVLVGAAERSAAVVPPGCSGKLVCVTVGSQVQASRSTAAAGTTAENDHYLTDTVTIGNGATSSNLVNVNLSVSWLDTGGTTGTTSEFRSTFSSSDPSGLTCSGTTSPITCSTPKSIGPGTEVTYTLVFRTAFAATSPDVSASSTDITATVSAKEQTNTNKQGKNAFANAGGSTSYEGSADLDISQAGGGIPTVTLGTAPGHAEANGSQFSKLPVPGSAFRELYTLSEQDYGSSVTCPFGTNSCVGQQVTVNATGLDPVNLQITYTGPIPSGLNEQNLRVEIDHDNGTSETFTTKCLGTALFSGVQPSNIPCRLANIDHSTNTVQVDIWAHGNSGYHVG